jgi:hypothetical protein
MWLPDYHKSNSRSAPQTPLIPASHCRYRMHSEMSIHYAASHDDTVCTGTGGEGRYGDFPMSIMHEGIYAGTLQRYSLEVPRGPGLEGFMAIHNDTV